MSTEEEQAKFQVTALCGGSLQCAEDFHRWHSAKAYVKMQVEAHAANGKRVKALREAMAEHEKEHAESIVHLVRHYGQKTKTGYSVKSATGSTYIKTTQKRVWRLLESDEAVESLAELLGLDGDDYLLGPQADHFDVIVKLTQKGRELLYKHSEDCLARGVGVPPGVAYTNAGKTTAVTITKSPNQLTTLDAQMMLPRGQREPTETEEDQ